jgi:hypothetical protein
MKLLKKLSAIILTLVMIAAAFTVNTHAITFVDLFASSTGEVINTFPAQSGGQFVEIEKAIVFYHGGRSMRDIEITQDMLIRNFEIERPELPDIVVLTERPSEWAVEQVMAAFNLGIVPPNLQSNFTQAITRAEFASLAVNLYEYLLGEIIGRVNFTDTNDINVEKAAYIGIVSGVGNNRFDPDATLTREQAAVMLGRLFRRLEWHSLMISVPIIDMVLQDEIEDYYIISPWALQSLAWIHSVGIMNGTGNRMFSPQADYTREQSIATIMRVFGFVRTDEPFVRVRQTEDKHL